MKSLPLTTLIIASFACGLSAGPVPAAEAEDWQVRRLLAPTPQERTAERQGTVFIYDGLNEHHVDQALEQAFDRVQSMMFVRVQPAEPEPEEYWLDDGCD